MKWNWPWKLIMQMLVGLHYVQMISVFLISSLLKHVPLRICNLMFKDCYQYCTWPKMIKKQILMKCHCKRTIRCKSRRKKEANHSRIWGLKVYGHIWPYIFIFFFTINVSSQLTSPQPSFIRLTFTNSFKKYVGTVKITILESAVLFMKRYTIIC